MPGVPIHTLDDTAERLDIRVTKGRSWVMPLEFTNDDGTALDMSAFTLTFDIYRGEDDTQPIESAVVTKPDAASGVVQVALDSATLDTMSGTYWYICDATDGTSLAPLFGGVFFVEKGAPR